MSIQFTIDEVSAVLVTADTFEEYEGQALQARDETIRQLMVMLAKAKELEAERAELEATRKAQAEFAKAQADWEETQRARQAEMDAFQRTLDLKAALLERSRLEALEQQAQRERDARERAESVEVRIQALRRLGSLPHSSLPSQEIQAELEVVQGMVITTDNFDSRVPEAMEARERTVNALLEQLAARQVEEVLEAEAMRKTRVEQLVEAVRRGATVAHELASVILSEQLRQLKAFDLSRGDFGDRLDEAERIQGEGINAFVLAIEAALVREHAGHEAREAVLRQEQQLAAETVRINRIKEAGPLLLDHLKALVACMADDLIEQDAVYGSWRSAVDLIAKLEGEAA